MLTTYLRERSNATQWFSATPARAEYYYQDSLLRLGIQQRVLHFDYQLELGQSTEFDLPTDAISAMTDQGQLGLGGTYYASNSSNAYPAAASLRAAFLRYHFQHDANTLRLGRFEFFEGQEITPPNDTLRWLQTNRIAQRLVGNFGFTTGQRSFDGADATVTGAHWNLTAMTGRAVQGVFNVNANPELNVDIQYLAYTRSLAHQHVLARSFALGYHDGRTGLTKTDNRALVLREADHKNIRIGTYGADIIAAFPLRSSTLDMVFWGALQNGRWGQLQQRSGGFALEAGWRLEQVRSRPWLRGGALRTTGDQNPVDSVHNTFFQVLPTPRVYARFPFFNMMNSKDQFVQLVDSPSSKINIRSDLHFLQLTAPADLWYQGGGAFDNKVFGYTGRASNNAGSFSSLYDISADYALNNHFALSIYYAHAFGKSVVRSIYTTDTNANFGYVELTYKLSQKLVHHGDQEAAR